VITLHLYICKRDTIVQGTYSDYILIATLIERSFK
jgi:hypothetical protein